MLIGEDVMLRPFTPDDVQRVGDWINSPMSHGPWANFWFRAMRDLEKRFDEDGLLAPDRGQLVLLTGDGQPAGIASFWTPVPGFDIREVQVLVPDPALREGDLETRALRLLVHYNFCGFPVNRVQAHCVARDARTASHCEAAGMIREGQMRETYLLRGEYQDELVFGILRREWKADGRYERLREVFAAPTQPKQGSVGFVRSS
jgi:RimJ/RimL family protein N-acetyltransferase